MNDPLKNKKSPRHMVRDDVAEREGFEPSNGFKPLHDFQSCALDQLSHLSLQAPRIGTLIYYNEYTDKMQDLFLIF